MDNGVIFERELLEGPHFSLNHDYEKGKKTRRFQGSLIYLDWAESNNANSSFEKSLQQGSLNYTFGGTETLQRYGNFEGFPLKNTALFGLVI